MSAYVALSYSTASSGVTRAVRWSGPYSGYDEGPTPAELEVAYGVLVDLAAGVSIEWALRRAGLS